MSVPDDPREASPSPRLSLEQLRKRAKDLRKAHRAAHPEAARRIQAALPRVRARTLAEISAGPLTLTEAQLVVAREAGFSSWPRAKHAIELASLSVDAAEAALLRAAAAGDAATVKAALEQHPDLTARSLHASIALGDAEAVDRWLSRDPELATRPWGPQGWAPLLYLCCVRLGAGAPGDGAARVRMARRLLELGADPSDGTEEMESTRGYRTALGGAVGCARSPELARTLLEAGADIVDGPSLYEGGAMWEAVRELDWESLRLLVEADPPTWQLCHALPQCLDHDEAEPVRLLLEHGADPNWTKGSWSFDGTALHEAIALDCSVEVLTLLLDAGARIDLRDREGCTPLAFAVRLARGEPARLLRERGATDAELTPVDCWVGACFREDEREATSLLRAHPELAGQLRRGDHQCVARAIRLGRPRAARLLLSGGARPDVPDDDGECALHLAAALGGADLCAELLDRGAPLHARNFDGKTALDCALADVDARRRDATLDLLRARGAGDLTEGRDAERDARFERAAEAIVGGDLETLRTLVADDPGLAQARSPRPHRATLLHYVGANGVERQATPPNAVEIAELLLDAGSDPDALCRTYRGGPEQTALGLLTSSHHPAEAGLMLPLIRVLARAGAELPEPYALLDALSEARHTRVSRAAEGPAFDPLDRVAQLALVEAARLNEPELVQHLIERGVDVNAAPSNGTSALHVAAMGGHAELVERLLERGADPTARDTVHGGAAAGWANAGGHAQLADRLRARARAFEDR